MNMKDKMGIKKALSEQLKEIDELSKCEIHAFKGFGKNTVVSFCELFQFSDIEHGASVVQQEIAEGNYKSIEDFDSYHTSDIEFTDLYSGKAIDEYREETKQNLIKLGMQWRKRVSNEYPEADVVIVVHQHEDEWFLDTFNYPVNIENAIYL